jgi:hypothetical protein
MAVKRSGVNASRLASRNIDDADREEAANDQPQRHGIVGCGTSFSI